MKKHHKIFVLCFPHLGVLDVWLPVVNRMNNLDSHTDCTLIIPDAMIVRNFHRDNIIVKMSDGVFNTVLIRTNNNTWIKHKSVSESIRWYQSKRAILRLINILEGLIRKPLFYFILIYPLILLRNIAYKKECKIKYENLNRTISDKDIMLYDIHTEGNRTVSDILQLFEDNKYSLPHALSMTINRDLHVNVNNKNKENITLYIYGKFQSRYYNLRYGIDENKMHVVGIPRHDSKWIKKIQDESTRLPNRFDNDKSVIVLSRHVSNVYCSYDEKKRSVRNIKKKIIDELGMKVVVKLHPSEKQERIFSSKNETIYEDEFGSNDYGLTWIYSDLHIFALGKGKKLIINLNTGVVFDAVAMGIPCIDYIDSNREKLTQFALHGGIVEKATNYQELSIFIDKWLSNPDKISTLSTDVYKNYFQVSSDISSRIATEILCKNEIIDQKI
jgi:hypothetical protein